jgi:hypothetical protein
MRNIINRKLVLPVASVVGASLFAVVLGQLPLSNASESAGARLVANDGQGATLTVTDLQPGDSITRTITIHNSSGLASRLSFTEQADPATYDAGNLRLAISRDGDEVYSGTFGGMADFAQDMGFLGARSATTFAFTVSLPDDAPLVRTGTETATATYTWLVADP